MMHTRQAGISLIELLIALAVGAFLILGVTQIYIDNKRNYLFQQGQSENQENGRYALTFLESQLAKAGYRRRPDIQMEDSFPADSTTTAGCDMQAGDVIKRVDATTLCIRYQPRDASELDCLGNGLSNTEMLEKPYTAPKALFVERYTLSNGVLSCTSGAQTGVLVDGLAGIRFDFGVGQISEGVIEEYKTEPASNDDILLARYSVLMETTRENLAQGIGSKAYQDWNGSGSTEPDDGRLYQIVQSSTMLRNVMP